MWLIHSRCDLARADDEEERRNRSDTILIEAQIQEIRDGDSGEKKGMV